MPEPRSRRASMILTRSTGQRPAVEMVPAADLGEVTGQLAFAWLAEGTRS